MTRNGAYMYFVADLATLRAGSAPILVESGSNQVVRQSCAFQRRVVDRQRLGGVTVAFLRESLAEVRRRAYQSNGSRSVPLIGYGPVMELKHDPDVRHAAQTRRAGQVASLPFAPCEDRLRKDFEDCR